MKLSGAFYALESIGPRMPATVNQNLDPCTKFFSMPLWIVLGIFAALLLGTAPTK
jgi:hypothetical protein